MTTFERLFASSTIDDPQEYVAPTIELIFVCGSTSAPRLDGESPNGQNVATCKRIPHIDESEGVQCIVARYDFDDACWPVLHARSEMHDVAFALVDDARGWPDFPDMNVSKHKRHANVQNNTDSTIVPDAQNERELDDDVVV